MPQEGKPAFGSGHGVTRPGWVGRDERGPESLWRDCFILVGWRAGLPPAESEAPENVGPGGRWVGCGVVISEEGWVDPPTSAGPATTLAQHTEHYRKGLPKEHSRKTWQRTVVKASLSLLGESTALSSAQSLIIFNAWDKLPLSLGFHLFPSMGVNARTPLPGLRCI